MWRAETAPMRARVLLLAYNRPLETERTIRALGAALNAARAHAVDARGVSAIEARIDVAIDGATDTKRNRAHLAMSDAERVDRVASLVRERLPHVKITRHVHHRGLPVVLLEALDAAFADPEIDRVICVEDDVDLATTSISALLHATERLPEPHVIAAAPLREEIPPNQCLLLTRGAHVASRPLLMEFITTFGLDGSYGSRDHDAIAAWLEQLAHAHGIEAPTGTSQDAVRALAWRVGGVAIHALPMRLVVHRGLRGAHNTPLHAARTGGLFERLDRSPWEHLLPRLDAWIVRGGGSGERQLSTSERLLGGAARSAYRALARVRRTRR